MNDDEHEKRVAVEDWQLKLLIFGIVAAISLWWHFSR